MRSHTNAVYSEEPGGKSQGAGGQSFLMHGVVTNASLCVSRRQRNPSLLTPVGLHTAGDVFGNEWLQQQSTPWSFPPLPTPDRVGLRWIGSWIENPPAGLGGGQM